MSDKPDWLLEWQDYPHGSMDVHQARQLNKYCVQLEDELALLESQLDAARKDTERLDWLFTHIVGLNWKREAIDAVMEPPK